MLTMDGWYIGRINSALADLNIATTIYPTDENVVPIIVDDNTKILRYREIKVDADQRYEQHVGPSIDITDDWVTATYEKADLPLSIAQDRARRAVKDYRVNGVKGVITVKLPLTPHVFDSQFGVASEFLDAVSVTVRIDSETIIALNSKLGTIGNAKIKWKFVDKWLDVTADDLVFIFNSINVANQKFFDQEFAFTMRINQASMLSDLRLVYADLDNIIRTNHIN